MPAYQFQIKYCSFCSEAEHIHDIDGVQATNMTCVMVTRVISIIEWPYAELRLSYISLFP